MGKPVVIVAPPFDDAIAKLGDDYTDTDHGDHIERFCHVVPLTADEVYQRQLAACHAARRAAYPPMGDQLDAIARSLTALADAGADLPAETRLWINACAAVKARYPKP